jgi:hypothetical protein
MIMITITKTNYCTRREVLDLDAALYPESIFRSSPVPLHKKRGYCGFCDCDNQNAEEEKNKKKIRKIAGLC